MDRSALFEELCSFGHLLHAFERAARGKRTSEEVAAFEARLADNVLDLREALLAGTYVPWAYRHFFVHEPKRRKISAAPFRDRVVHHALVAAIESRFESLFVAHSYANRIGKGTHRAIEQFQCFASRHRYVLRADIRQHFASIDHAILMKTLGRRVVECDVMELVERLLRGGADVLTEEYTMRWFPDDDLFALCRGRGLPIGNLTSQF